MVLTRPLSLNQCNASELSNMAAISPFRHITWPTSVSIHDKTFKDTTKMTYVKLLKPRFLHLLLYLDFFNSNSHVQCLSPTEFIVYMQQDGDEGIQPLPTSILLWVYAYYYCCMAIFLHIYCTCFSTFWLCYPYIPFHILLEILYIALK